MKKFITNISRITITYSKFLIMIMVLSSSGTPVKAEDSFTYLKCGVDYLRLTGNYISSNYNIRNKKFLHSYKIKEYGEKWISRFEKFILFFRIFIISFGLVLFFGMILIVSNTIKISIYSRKEELDLMLLLGARNQFIKAPLIMEGILHGIVGVLIGLVVVKLVHGYLDFQFQGVISSVFRGIEFQYLTNNLMLSMFGAGIFIGMFGSLLSVNQFLSRRFRE